MSSVGNLGIDVQDMAEEPSKGGFMRICQTQQVIGEIRDLKRVFNSNLGDLVLQVGRRKDEQHFICVFSLAKDTLSILFAPLMSFLGQKVTIKLSDAGFIEEISAGGR